MKKGRSLAERIRDQHLAVVRETPFLDVPMARVDQMAAWTRECQDSRLRNSTYLGEHARTGNAVFASHDMWPMGTFMLAPPRTGKTSKGMASILSQALQRTKKNSQPVLVLDFKPDPFLMNVARLECLRAGRKFKFFTNMPQRTTYLWNPFLDKALQASTGGTISGIFGRSSGLDFGLGYGKSFFWAQGRCVFTLAYDELQKRSSTTTKAFTGEVIRKDTDVVSVTFNDMAEIAEVISTRKEFGDAPALKMALQKAGEVFPLNQTQKSLSELKIPERAFKEAIQISDLLQRNKNGEYDCYYFALSPFDQDSAVLIGKLVLALAQLNLTHYQYAFHNGDLDEPRPDLFCLVDEWQYLADNYSMATMLAQSGSQGLFFALANQTLDQLPSDLQETPFANCGIRIFMAARGPEIQKRLMATSGEKLRYLPAQTMHGNCTDSLSFQPFIRPYVELNDLIGMEKRKEALCFLPSVGTGAAYGGHPFFIKMPHRYPKAVHEAISQLPWPEATDETVVPTDYIFGCFCIKVRRLSQL